MHELNKKETSEEMAKKREEKDKKRKEKNAMARAFHSEELPENPGPSIRNDTLKREQMDKALGRYHPPQKTKLTEAMKDFQHIIEEKAGATETIKRI